MPWRNGAEKVDDLLKPLNDKSKPILMIAAGSGLAPFRAVWQARSEEPDKLVLFFGCRDWASNLLEDETEGVLTRYNAFSRQIGEPKKYVQDLVLDHQEMVKKMVMDQEGYILVCGMVKKRKTAFWNDMLTGFVLRLRWRMA